MWMIYFVTSTNENNIQDVKEQLKQGFYMTDLGHLHYYLGIEMIQKPYSIFITQEHINAAKTSFHWIENEKPYRKEYYLH